MECRHKLDWSLHSLLVSIFKQGTIALYEIRDSFFIKIIVRLNLIFFMSHSLIFLSRSVRLLRPSFSVLYH